MVVKSFLNHRYIILFNIHYTCIIIYVLLLSEVGWLPASRLANIAGCTCWRRDTPQRLRADDPSAGSSTSLQLTFLFHLAENNQRVQDNRGVLAPGCRPTERPDRRVHTDKPLRNINPSLVTFSCIHRTYQSEDQSDRGCK